MQGQMHVGTSPRGFFLRRGQVRAEYRGGVVAFVGSFFLQERFGSPRGRCSRGESTTAPFFVHGRLGAEYWGLHRWGLFGSVYVRGVPRLSTKGMLSRREHHSSFLRPRPVGAEYWGRRCGLLGQSMCEGCLGSLRRECSRGESTTIRRGQVGGGIQGASLWLCWVIPCAGMPRLSTKGMLSRREHHSSSRAGWGGVGVAV